MVKGDTCIEIPKLGGAYVTPKRYCDECYGLILIKTNEDIAEISKSDFDLLNVPTSELVDPTSGNSHTGRYGDSD